MAFGKKTYCFQKYFAGHYLIDTLSAFASDVLIGRGGDVIMVRRGIYASETGLYREQWLWLTISDDSWRSADRLSGLRPSPAPHRPAPLQGAHFFDLAKHRHTGDFKFAFDK